MFKTTVDFNDLRALASTKLQRDKQLSPRTLRIVSNVAWVIASLLIRACSSFATLSGPVDPEPYIAEQPWW